MKLINPEDKIFCTKIVLEPLLASHAAILFDKLQDKSIFRFIPQDPPKALEDLVNRYSLLSSRLSPDKTCAWLNWVIRGKDNNDYYGLIEAEVRSDSTAGIACIIFPAYWQKGIGFEACSEVLRHLFVDYKVTLVKVEIDTRNIASIKLFESLGFYRHSVNYDADFFKGEASHEYNYTLTRE